MAWRTIVDIADEFTPSETAALQAVQGSTSKLAARLTDSIAAWIGALSATGVVVAKDGSVPDQLRRHVKAEAVWLWLAEFPRLQFFKTKAREEAYKESQAVFAKVVSKTYGAVETPDGADNSTANWNSAPKLIGRMNPVPLPIQQLQQSPTPIYSNPNAPLDTVPSNSPGLPLAPLGLVALGADGKVLVAWDPVPGAVTYKLYRSTTSLKETVVQASLSTTNYSDTGLTNGTTYFYQVTSVNATGESPLSNEVSVKPNTQPPT